MKESLQIEVDSFLYYLKYEKNSSKYTLLACREDLKKLLELVIQHQVHCWQSVTNSHIRRSLALLYQEGISGKSLQRTLSHWRQFFRFLLNKDQVDQNPTEGVKAPKAASKLPQILGVDQLNRILQGKDNSQSKKKTSENALFFEKRDLAILELLYSSGLRLSELSALDVDSFLDQGTMVKVMGKRRRERIVPVGSKAKEAIQGWLKWRSMMLKKEEKALFVSIRGNRLCNRQIQNRVKQYTQCQDVSGGVSPHTLRHSCASHLLESSGDLRGVQELLGHEDISTTQIYTHLDFQHLATVYNQSHPRAVKKKENKKKSNS